jgi:signal transduction histidine kinase
VRDECHVQLDPALFELAFFNILHNALHYTRPGNKVAVIVRKTKKYVHITVQDSGLGIPQYLLDNDALFAPHLTYDHNNPNRTGYDIPIVSAGLGLTLARGIIEAHGGKLSIESVHGEGTTVDIFFKEAKSSKTIGFGQSDEAEPAPHELTSERLSALEAGLAGIMDKPEWA